MIIVGVVREEDRWDLDRAGGQHAQKGEMGQEPKKKKKLKIKRIIRSRSSLRDAVSIGMAREGE